MINIDMLNIAKREPPKLIEELDPEKIFSDMLANLSAELPNVEFSSADPIYKVLQVSAYREAMLRKRFNDAARQCLAAFATGKNLDFLAHLFHVSRSERPGESISDEKLLEKMLMAPDESTTAGSKAGYKAQSFKALGSERDDVLDINAHCVKDSEIAITVLFSDKFYLPRGSEGMSEEERAKKEAELAQIRLEKLGKISQFIESVRPMTDRVSVRDVEFRDYKVKASLKVDRGSGEAALFDAKRSLEEFANRAFRIEKKIYLSALYAALHVANVEAVTITEPKEDINANLDSSFFSVPRLTGVEVTVES